jgi:leucyl aminopeptidase
VAITAELSKLVPDDVDAVAIGVLAGAEPDGADAAFLTSQGFEAEAGDVRAVPGTDGTPRYVMGLGDADALDPQVLRRAAGNLGRSAGRVESIAVDVAAVAGAMSPADAAVAVAEGVALGAYHYTEFKSSPTPNRLARLVLVGGGGQRVQAALDRGVAVAEAVTVARDLANEPGGSLTPPKFADKVVALGEAHGFEVEVWDDKRIRKEGLGGLLGVNRGSMQPARFLQLRLEPPKARTTLALVGKGITFDSGGLSLKPSDSMAGMQGDMGGAAAVVGTFVAAASLGTSKARLLGFVPLTDNMTGPDATRIGDVLTIRNGTTVEVLNTDAEGRLVLADGLSLATEAAPDAIIDVATLTGACMVALGERIAGVMGNHRGLADQVQAAADAAGEPVWPLPLPAGMRPKLDSDVADLKNITSSRYGGALAAGLFLQEFVGGDIPWAHLDIAGPAWSSEIDGELNKGGTGFGVRTLTRLVTSFSRPKPADR